MVNYEMPDLDGVFHALADPTRRAILARLRAGPATISEIAAPFGVSFAAVSKHVGVLERAGLLRREVRGRSHYCHLDPTPLRAVAAFADDYLALWEKRLDALEDLLEREAEA